MTASRCSVCLVNNTGCSVKTAAPIFHFYLYNILFKNVLTTPLTRVRSNVTRLVSVIAVTMVPFSIAVRNVVVAFIIMPRTAHGLDNGVGLTPAMGYNTWDDFRCGGINASNLMKASVLMKPAYAPRNHLWYNTPLSRLMADTLPCLGVCVVIRLKCGSPGAF